MHEARIDPGKCGCGRCGRRGADRPIEIRMLVVCQKYDKDGLSARETAVLRELVKEL